MFEYRYASVADAIDLSSRLRPQDHKEVALATGDVRAALIQAVMITPEPIAAVEDGKVISIGGVVPGVEAIPWMLASPEVYRHRKKLVAHARVLVNNWAWKYPILKNYVHTENTASIRWLKHLGFTIEDPVPFGIEGALFHPFHRHRDV